MIIMKDVSYAEKHVNGDNSIDFYIYGYNTKGNKVVLKIEHQPTWLIAHLVETGVAGIKEVRKRVQRDLDLIKQDLDA